MFRGSLGLKMGALSVGWFGGLSDHSSFRVIIVRTEVERTPVPNHVPEVLCRRIQLWIQSA